MKNETCACGDERTWHKSKHGMITCEICECDEYTPSGKESANASQESPNSSKTGSPRDSANEKNIPLTPPKPMCVECGKKTADFCYKCHDECHKPMCIHTNCREEATKNYCANHFGQIQVNWLKLMQSKQEIDEEKLAEWLFANVKTWEFSPLGEFAKTQPMVKENYMKKAKEAIEHAKRK